jgi:hypothetical protein
MQKRLALIFAVILILGCISLVEEEKEESNMEENVEEFFEMEVPTEEFDVSSAYEIAAASECIEVGEILANPTYNADSHTWWFDIDADKEGCNPACVVHLNQRVEVNWRCTGAIPP